MAVVLFPSLLISNEDAHEINILQSHFYTSCDCQGIEISNDGTDYYNDARCQGRREMWQINSDIKAVLAKYPWVPNFLFIETCKKVPEDYEG